MLSIIHIIIHTHGNGRLEQQIALYIRIHNVQLT
jgi:hypothetical protein